MIKKIFITKISIVIAALLLLLVLVVNEGVIRATTEYNSQSDALVTDYEYYESFGGKYNQHKENRTYNVYFPAGFNFIPDGDTLQLIVAQGGGGYIADGSAAQENDCTSDGSGGYNCKVVWNLTQNKLREGEASLEFKVLDSDTQTKGRIFIDFRKISGGYIPASGLVVFVDDPVASPYVELEGVVNNTTLTSRELSPDIIDLVARTLVENDIQSVDFYINGELVNSDNTPTKVSGSSWNNRETANFSYTWEGVKDLSKGEYRISAVANYGNGKSTPVVLATGENSAIISVAFDNTQVEVCKAQQIALSKLMNSIVDSRNRELKNLELIDSKVRDFFKSNTYELPDFSETISNLDSLNEAVYQQLTDLINKSNLMCDSSTPQQIDSFKESLDATYESLIVYRDGIVSFITNIEGVANESGQ